MQVTGGDPGAGVTVETGNTPKTTTPKTPAVGSSLPFTIDPVSSSSQYGKSYEDAAAFLKGLMTYTTSPPPGATTERFGAGMLRLEDMAYYTEKTTKLRASQKMAEWQAYLVQAGLISPRAKIQLGKLDDLTISATRKLYRYMQNNNMTDPYGALKDYGKSTVDLSGGGGGGGRQIPAFRPVDDATVKAYGTKFAQGTLGRDFTASEHVRFAKVFRGLERQGYDRDIKAMSGATEPQTTAEGIQEAEMEQLQTGGGPQAKEAFAYNLARGATAMSQAVSRG